MICPSCHTENEDSMSFCVNCGRRIPKCPTCGLVLTQQTPFCVYCGTRIPEEVLSMVPEQTASEVTMKWDTPMEATLYATPSGRSAPEERAECTAPSDFRMPEATVLAAPDSPEIPPEAAYSASGWNVPEERTAFASSNPNGGEWMPDAQVYADNQRPLQPQQAFCENCGKRIRPGTRLCSACSTGEGNAQEPKKKRKWITVLILVVLLLLALLAGIYAIGQSDLFDWGSSSTSSGKDDKDGEDDKNSEDDGDDEPGNAPAASDGNDQGAHDPVEESTAATQPETQPETENTEPVVETIPETVAPTVDTEQENTNRLMYWIENCDKMYLSESDLAGLNAQECIYARNACYAKSGRKFNSTELQTYFSQFSWYHPTIAPENFSPSMLNSYQVSNINRVLEYEQAHGY